MDETYRDRLHVACAAHGIETPTQLARLAHIPRTTASRHLHDELRFAEIITIYRIADSVRFRPRWLVLGDGRPEQGVRTENEAALLARFRCMSAAEQKGLLALLEQTDRHRSQFNALFNPRS